MPAGPIRTYSRTVSAGSKLITGKAYMILVTVSFTSDVCSSVQGVLTLANSLLSGSVRVAKSCT
jgi:hypothetical protein